jgi:hypothetical protein
MWWCWVSDDALGLTVGAIACWAAAFGLLKVFKRRASLSEFMNRNQGRWPWFTGRPHYILGDYEQTIDLLTVTLLFMMLVAGLVGLAFFIAAFPVVVPELFK